MASRLKTILLLAGFLIPAVIFAVNGVAASPPKQDPEFVFVVTTTEDHNDGSCDADCSLRDAIIAANKTEFHDTILLPSGTYTLTLEGSGEDDGLTGDLDITSALTIVGYGAETTIIDAGGLTGRPDRVFDMHADYVDPFEVGLSALTITGGRAWGGQGGGIKIRNAEVDLDHSSVRANSAEWGGGIYTYGGPVQLVDCTISENTAQTGGGLYLLQVTTAELNHTSIIGNVATGAGGGIHSNDADSLALKHCTVSANHAGEGGGINSFASAATLLQSTISGNYAEYGGGIHHLVGSLYVDQSSINGNTAEFEGGGIFYFLCDISDDVRLLDSTISGNSAGTSGGGIYNHGCRLYLYNSTVSENSAPNGGGIHIREHTWLKNTIVAINPIGGDCYDLRGGLLSNGHNLDSDGTCNLTTEGDLPNTDPRLGPLQDNGGPTPTHALLFGSLAMDAGDDSDCPATDQRGFIRPMDGDGDGTATCDIGAFEHLELRGYLPVTLNAFGPAP